MRLSKEESVFWSSASSSVAFKRFAVSAWLLSAAETRGAAALDLFFLEWWESSGKLDFAASIFASRASCSGVRRGGGVNQSYLFGGFRSARQYGSTRVG